MLAPFTGDFSLICNSPIVLLFSSFRTARPTALQVQLTVRQALRIAQPGMAIFDGCCTFPLHDPSDLEICAVLTHSLLYAPLLRRSPAYSPTSPAYSPTR
jgi:hypothetical protein